MTVTSKTKAEYLALIKRSLSDAMVSGWEGKGGEEVFSAVAAIAAKISERQAQMMNARYILRATGPQRATGTITVTWTLGTTLAHTLASGQVIAQTRWGVEYRLTEDLVVGAGAAAPTAVTVGVEAVLADFESNVAAVHVDQWALPGGVNRKENVLWDDAVTTDGAKDEFLAGLDAGEITIAGATAMTGGSMSTLDLIAAGRGKPRALDETDQPLRKRLRKGTLRITPVAILAACNEVLQPYGVTATLWEPWVDGWFTIGSPTAGGIGDSDYPVSRIRHFRINVPNLGYSVSGFVVGDSTQGVIGESDYGIGIGDTTSAGVIAGLQQLVDRISLGGVWGHVSESA